MLAIRTGFVVAVGLAVVPMSAHADDEAAVRLLFAHGRQAFERGDWQSALASFTAAYETAPLPGFLFNIAQCHRKLEHWEEARDFLNRYLGAMPDAPNSEDAEQLLAEIAEASRASTTAEHEEQRLPAAAATVEPSPSHPTPPPATRASSGARIGLLTWIGFGLGLALAAGGLYFALDMQSRQNKLDAPNLECARNPDTCRELVDQADASALASNILFVSAGAVLVGAGVLLIIDLTSEDSASDGRRARLSLRPAGASLELAF